MSSVTPIPPKKNRWTSAADLVTSFGWRSGAQPDQLSILNAVWEKEMGHMARHFSLVGMQKGTLYVKPRSAAAAQELQMRAGDIMRALNKYFSRNFIKQVKATSR